MVISLPNQSLCENVVFVFLIMKYHYWLHCPALSEMQTCVIVVLFWLVQMFQKVHDILIQLAT